MSICFVHFSDIHFKNSSNRISDRISQIEDSLSGSIEKNSEVIMLFSGDIAFSGLKEQYEIAKNFFDAIIEYIKNDLDSNVSFFLVPGNHDCDFNDDDQIRKKLIKTVEPSEVDIKYYNTVNTLQTNFNDFAKQYNNYYEKIILTKTIQIGDNKILFLLVNSAWMSELHENMGRIVIPDLYETAIHPENYKFVALMQHHPLGWLNHNYSEFENFIRNNVDIVFFGHEHKRDNYTVSSPFWNLTEFHGKELQNIEGDKDQSGFSLIKFDDDFSNYQAFDFDWDGSTYKCTKNPQVQFHRNRSAIQNILFPNEEAIKYINDVGLNIKHFAKDNILLSDIYIWPNLQVVNLETEDVHNKKIKDNIFETISSSSGICIISGESLGGKTSFAKMCFFEYIKLKEKCCIYANGKDITIRNKNYENIIKNIVENQFSLNDFSRFETIEFKNKAIIIDDFDFISFKGASNRKDFIKYISQNYDTVIIIISNEVEYTTLLTSDYFENKELSLYNILPLGNKKRYDLIYKWYSLGCRFSEEEIKIKTKESFSKLNVILGSDNAIMPALPISIITILQNIDAADFTSFNESQYGFLYESLIQRSLYRIPNHLNGDNNIYIQILSALAFNMLKNKSHSFTSEQLAILINEFKEDKLIKLNSNNFLNQIVEVDLVKISNSTDYRFKYSYIYYYFCGKYISSNITKKEVKEIVEYMCERLYNVDYGNIVIFICHLTNNEDVIDTILLNSYDILKKCKEFSFADSKGLLGNIQEVVSININKLRVGSNTDVTSNNNTRMEQLDYGDEKDEINDDIDDEEKVIADLTSAFKTLDVLGHVLKNYPGTISGENKLQIIDEIYKLAMRVISAYSDALMLIKKDIVDYFVTQLKKRNQNIILEKLESDITRILILIFSRVASMIIRRIAFSYSSEYLLEAVNKGLEDELSKCLIMNDLNLNCLHIFNPDSIIKNGKRIKNEFNNPLAYYIYRSSVAHYLRYNECDYKIRSMLCNEFDLLEKNIFLDYNKQSSDKKI